MTAAHAALDARAERRAPTFPQALSNYLTNGLSISVLYSLPARYFGYSLPTRYFDYSLPTGYSLPATRYFRSYFPIIFAVPITWPRILPSTSCRLAPSCNPRLATSSADSVKL